MDILELAREEPVGKMTKEGWKQPYHWDQTGVVLDPNVTLLKTSDELDWSDVCVSLASGVPCELVHPALPDLWLLMPLNGMDVTVTFDGREQNLTLPANRLFIIAPGTPWNARLRKAHRAINVFMRRRVLAEVGNELFERDVTSLEIISKSGIQDRSIAGLLHLLKEALDEPKGHADLKVEHIARALAADVLRKHSAPLLESPIAQDQLTVNQAKLVIDYIQQHLPSTILLNDLAALSGLSRTYFVQRFNASFGVSPYRYIIEARIGLAQKLLESSNLPLAQIAALCGFADQAHLGVTFKRIAGMTPARYRQII